MVQVQAPRTIRYIFVNLISSCHYFMLYLCFETFYFYFYSDPQHFIFEKNCRKPRNIKSLALLCIIMQTGSCMPVQWGCGWEGCEGGGGYMYVLLYPVHVNLHRANKIFILSCLISLCYRIWLKFDTSVPD